MKNQKTQEKQDFAAGYGKWIGLIIAAKAVIILVAIVIILLIKSLSLIE